MISRSFSAPSQRPFIAYGGSSQGHNQARKAPPRQLTPLPKSLSKLLPMLLQRRMVAKEIPRDNPLIFTGFELSKVCEFHMEETGHNGDNCLVSKKKIQNLIDKEILSFKDPQPNVQQNSLPDHVEAIDLVMEARAGKIDRIFSSRIGKVYDLLVMKVNYTCGSNKHYSFLEICLILCFHFSHSLVSIRKLELVSAINASPTMITNFEGDISTMIRAPSLVQPPSR